MSFPGIAACIVDRVKGAAETLEAVKRAKKIADFIFDSFDGNLHGDFESFL